jgi:hypothetical protein
LAIGHWRVDELAQPRAVRARWPAQKRRIKFAQIEELEAVLEQLDDDDDDVARAPHHAVEDMMNEIEDENTDDEF